MNIFSSICSRFSMIFLTFLNQYTHGHDGISDKKYYLDNQLIALNVISIKFFFFSNIQDLHMFGRKWNNF